jgi:flagellar L-ring protein precursor FlgH
VIARETIMTDFAPLPLGIPAWSRRKPRRAPVPGGGRRVPLLAATVMAAAAMAATPAVAKRHNHSSGFEATLPAMPMPRPADGGIFNVSAGYAPLYGGTRAFSVGDTLTVLLVESTTTAKSVAAKNARTGGASIAWAGSGSLAVSPGTLKGSNDSSFNGQGNAAQTNSLAGTLSVTIAEVRPERHGASRGEKRMLLSQGNEWIQILGDRAPDRHRRTTRSLDRVADAHIEYSGKGALQQASKQGWLGRSSTSSARFEDIARALLPPSPSPPLARSARPAACRTRARPRRVSRACARTSSPATASSSASRARATTISNT